MFRNTIRVYGESLEYEEPAPRGEYTVRVHSDASFNNQGHLSEAGKDYLIGYGYCVELAPYAPQSTIPAYGYGTVDMEIYDCSTSAELLGVIASLKETGLDENVEIVCDNKDAVTIANLVFTGTTLADFEVNEVMSGIITELEAYAHRGLTARWVRGHDGDLYNHAVNSLARMARKTVKRATSPLKIAIRESNMISTFHRMRTTTR